MSVSSEHLPVAAPANLMARLFFLVFVVCVSPSPWVLAATGSDDVVIEFEEQPGELDRALTGPSLRVFGDGWVEVSRPPFMKEAGTYRLRLSVPELDALVVSLVNTGVVEFDEGTVRAAKRESVHRRERGTVGAPLLYTSDPSVVRIRVRLVADGAGAVAGTPVDKSIVWTGLRSDRARFPDVAPLQGLGRAADGLRALMNRPDLVRAD